MRVATGASAARKIPVERQTMTPGARQGGQRASPRGPISDDGPVRIGSLVRCAKARIDAFFPSKRPRDTAGVGKEAPMFKKIVVATDGSEPSDHAVGMARTVASSLGSEVIVL